MGTIIKELGSEQSRVYFRKAIVIDKCSELYISVIFLDKSFMVHEAV